MKLIDMHFYLYAPDFIHPVRTPKVEMFQRKTLFVEWIDDQGGSWFGECNAFETDWYHHETIAHVKATLMTWFKSVRYQSITSFDSAQKYLDALDDTPAARATAAMAFYQMFHSLASFHVPMTITINGDFSQRMMRFDHAGRIKIKWSDQIVNQVKMIASMYPDIPISTDANQILTLEQLGELKRLSRDVAYIEEPFKNFNEDLPYEDLPSIAIDEQATSLEHILRLVHDFPIKTVVLKPFRLGGIDRVLNAIKVLKSRQISVVIGGMYECGLSRYFTAWLSQWGDYSGDVPPEGYYFEQELTENTGRLHNGQLYFEPPVVNQSLLQEWSE